MIISASRRTDIPAYYSEWFFNRIKEGFVCVRNPRNPHRISQIPLSPEAVDGIVFWTKNPYPMLGRLNELHDYTYYFQFTLNPYGADIEKNVPSKEDIVIPAFQKLSSVIGRERVVWRYDPILLNDTYTLPYHIETFRAFCGRLGDYTEKCTISFLDMYKNIQSRLSPLGIHPPTPAQADELAGRFSLIAGEYGIYIDTCAENIDLGKYNIGHAACIERERLERIGKFKLDVKRDMNQRAACRCVSSVDIGAYNTCGHGCAYCYASFSQAFVRDCFSRHNPLSPLLYGDISEQDIIKPKEPSPFKSAQMKLSDYDD